MIPFHLPELLIILFVVLLIFGARKLPELGAGMGRGIKELKKGLRDESTSTEVEKAREPVSE